MIVVLFVAVVVTVVVIAHRSERRATRSLNAQVEASARWENWGRS